MREGLVIDARDIIGTVFMQQVHDDVLEALAHQIMHDNAKSLRRLINFCDDVLKPNVSNVQRQQYWVDVTSGDFKYDDSDLIDVYKTIRFFAKTELERRANEPKVVAKKKRPKKVSRARK